MKRFMLLLCLFALLLSAAACGDATKKAERNNMRNEAGRNELIFPNPDGSVTENMPYAIENTPYTLPVQDEDEPSARRPIRRPPTLFSEKKDASERSGREFIIDERTERAIESGDHDRAAAAILFGSRTQPGNPSYLYKLPSSLA